jgi:excisionase family DNA binding protein
MSNRFMTVREASEFLRISQSAIRLWIGQGRLKAVRAGSRVLVDREYLEAGASTGELLEPGTQSVPTSEEPTGAQ